MHHAKYAPDEHAEQAKRLALDEIANSSGVYWGLSGKTVIWHGTRHPVYWAFVTSAEGKAQFVCADSSTMVIRAIRRATRRSDEGNGR